MRPRKLNLALLYIAAVVGLVVTTFPYLYMGIQSFSPWDEVDRRILPSKLTLRSYRWLFAGGGAAKPWFRAFLNSCIVAGSSTAAIVFTAALVGYALSWSRFRGRKTIYNLILFQMFYPGIVLLVPTFLLVRWLGLYNTYGGMILPKAFHLWAVFLYTSFFATIPKEIVESARVDGASELRVIFNIVLPMSRSITAVIFLIEFMRRWEELLWDMIVVQDYQKMTLNVLLAMMAKGEYIDFPGPMYAASFVLTFPILVLFLIFGKRFVEGFAMTLK